MLIGMKCADFVSLSTITQIASCPFEVFGKLVTKSMDILSHFHSGTSKGVNNPAGF